MGSLSVWAPHAGRVEVILGQSRLDMTKDPARPGSWTIEHEGLVPGADYRFSLDQHPPLPDPRARFQPEGVHGPSRIVDLSDFPWSDASFQPTPLSHAVLYELHVGTFSPEGTLEGAERRLGDLQQLGVTHVQLMPLNAFPGRHGWGYDGVDLFAVHAAYGTPASLCRFIDACHARGLTVLLDVVYNHLGPDGNYLSQYGPYFTSTYTTPWGEAVNLDGAGSDEVRRFIVDNACMWLRDYHIDGLRLDAVHALLDRSAVHLLEELSQVADRLSRELNRRKVLIAESDLNDPRLLWPRAEHGYGLDAQWSDDFHHALHAYLTGERNGYYQDFGSLADLAKALSTKFVYDGRYSAYRGRRHGRTAEDVPHSRFLGYTQTHDQVGNRAKGDRLGHLVELDKLKLAATLMLLSPFVPMLFQGEEWNSSSPFAYFTDHVDHPLAEAVRQGRRREFAAFVWKPEEIPDPQAEETFMRSKLRWEERAGGEHGALWSYYRALIQLRRSRIQEVLEPPRVDHDEGRAWLRMTRSGLTVALNFGTQALVLPVEHPDVLLASNPAVRRTDAGLQLPPRSAAVLGSVR